ALPRPAQPPVARAPAAAEAVAHRRGGARPGCRPRPAEPGRLQPTAHPALARPVLWASPTRLDAASGPLQMVARPVLPGVCGMSRRAGFVLAMALLLTVGLIASYVLGKLEPYEDVVEHGPSPEVASSPYLAAEHFLRKQGIAAHRAEGLEVLDGLPSEG